MKRERFKIEGEYQDGKLDVLALTDGSEDQAIAIMFSIEDANELLLDSLPEFWKPRLPVIIRIVPYSYIGEVK